MYYRHRRRRQCHLLPNAERMALHHHQNRLHHLHGRCLNIPVRNYTFGNWHDACLRFERGDHKSCSSGSTGSDSSSTGGWSEGSSSSESVSMSLSIVMGASIRISDRSNKTCTRPRTHLDGLPQAYFHSILELVGQSRRLVELPRALTRYLLRRNGGITPFSGGSFSIRSDILCSGLSPADDNCGPAVATVSPCPL